MPAIGSALREVTAQERTIRLHWADGRPVMVPPLYEPTMRKDACPDDDDEEG